ncbi:MAG: AAA family ATPase, partial [Chthoniobacterales bacterium]|nr:AAA family ATPase [Chthoniobacterales bacterium]
MVSASGPLPKRVLLKGFDAQARPLAVDWLKDHAIEVVNILKLADLVVAGPEAEPALLQKARVEGPKILSWDELRAFVAASDAGNARLNGLAASEEDPTDDAFLLAQMSGNSTHPIEHTPDGVRILDLLLPYSKSEGAWASRIPDASQFQHLCMDRPFLETLRAVALGVLYGIPVALEGDTAASKTSAVLYLAHLLGQPVVRLNLNGHTDASELVGRYVPADSTDLIDWNDVAPETQWLTQTSRKLLTNAAHEERQLSRLEKLSLIGREKIPVTGWRFQEGYLPQAMRHGWWILLDEMNLAETQVLERLNCALENPPGLVLTEGSGIVFGQGGDVPVHPAFRMLATMNPAEYTGRAVMSQAFADRWGLWHQSALPGEREIEQMLLRLVFGEHPRVLIGGRGYKAEKSSAVFPELQAIPEISSLLQ